eukprot:8773642-Pyramimonas_sp.AAC.3
MIPSNSYSRTLCWWKSRSDNRHNRHRCVFMRVNKHSAFISSFIAWSSAPKRRVFHVHPKIYLVVFLRDRLRRVSSDRLSNACDRFLAFLPLICASLASLRRTLLRRHRASPFGVAGPERLAPQRPTSSGPEIGARLDHGRRRCLKSGVSPYRGIFDEKYKIHQK